MKEAIRIENTNCQFTDFQMLMAICRLAVTSSNKTKGTISRVGKNNEALATTIAENPKPAYPRITAAMRITVYSAAMSKKLNPMLSREKKEIKLFIATKCNPKICQSIKRNLV